MRDVNGKIRPRLGSKMGVITKIFANPVVPQIDDYYEPFTFDYEHLHSAPEGKHIPTARPRSLIDGKRMDKVIWGQTGKNCWAANSKNAPMTATSRPCKRRCTGSLKTPS